jgi:hypothetical protein
MRSPKRGAQETLRREGLIPKTPLQEAGSGSNLTIGVLRNRAQAGGKRSTAGRASRGEARAPRFPLDSDQKWVILPTVLALQLSAC